MLWSWTLTLLIGIVVIGLSIGFIWLTFEIFIKDNEQARQQMFD